MVTNLYIFTQISKCTNKNIFTIAGRLCNIAGLLYPVHLLSHHFLVFGKQCCECSVGIRHPNKRCTNMLVLIAMIHLL